MRPEILNYLYCGLDKVTGVGSKTLASLYRLLSTYGRFPQLSQPPRYYMVDLLYHLPIGIIDRTYTPPLTNAQDKCIATLIVTPQQYILPKTPRQPYRIICTNQTGQVTVVLFKIFGNYLEKYFPLGTPIVISGKLELGVQGWQMLHPDMVTSIQQLAEVRKIQAVYPAVAGVTQNLLRNTIRTILEALPELPEWITPTMLQQHQWLGWRDSLQHLHQQLQGVADISANSIYLQRLAYDEMLATQLAFQLTKRQLGQQEGQQISIDVTNPCSLRNRLLAQLPFQLTAGQLQVLQEIEADLSSPKRMLRLLQGDVGSGKTIVALLAMLAVVEQHQQAAIIVPLSILANQHYQTFSRWCEPLGVRVALLTSKLTPKQRRLLLQQLQAGEIDIVVGTHSVFQEQVEFQQLSLVVIDEQHRFGVVQRLHSVHKGRATNILLMTATPIPRTLQLSMYGDLDISTLNDKPQQRQPVTTVIMDDRNLEKIYQGLERVMAAGDKIFWLCPLINPDTDEETSKRKTATELRTLELQKQFGTELVLSINGQMKPTDKEKIMEQFADPQSTAKILVATTVIEVGVDIPQATVMVIENADTFGLAQLHQLRGRVGRGDKPAFCILLHTQQLGSTARQRLNALKQHEDGFSIAELDLQLRGGGKIFGTAQSGNSIGISGVVSNQRELLEQAHLQAEYIMHTNAELRGSEGEKYRILLHLLRYDSCLELLHGG